MCQFVENLAIIVLKGYCGIIVNHNIQAKTKSNVETQDVKGLAFALLLEKLVSPFSMFPKSRMKYNEYFRIRF